MNSWQKRVLIVVATVVGVTLLYPPFHLVKSGGAKLALGHSWIFAPPRAFATIDVPLLLTQWLGLAIIAAIAYALLGAGREEARPNRTVEAQPAIPTLRDRVLSPEESFAHRPSVMRHVVRWTTLVFCCVLATALFGLSGELLKALGVTGFLSGAIRGALSVWFLSWAWRASRRIVATNPAQSPNPALNADARQAGSAHPPRPG